MWTAYSRAATKWPRGIATAIRREVLPDYNRKAERCWWLTVVAGATILGHAVFLAASAPIATSAWLLVICLLAAACASFQYFTHPRTSAGVDGSEFLVILALLALGPDMAPLVAASNAAAGALLNTKRWSGRLFSPAVAALSAALAALVHIALGTVLDRLGLSRAWASPLQAVAAGAMYLTASVLLVSTVPRLKRNLSPLDWQALLGNRWLALAYAGAALAACLVWHALQQHSTKEWLLAIASVALLLISLLIVAVYAVVSERNRTQAAEDRASAMNVLATTDPLTGLTNRRGFNLALQAGPSVLLLLDVDGFKQVNDRHGHPAGDRLLQLIAGRLQRELRPTDRLARLGGDEFAVLVAGSLTPPEMATLAQRLVDSICEPFALDGALVQVGISVGVAHGTAAPEELVSRADHALLAAKRKGKSTWCQAEQIAPP